MTFVPLYDWFVSLDGTLTRWMRSSQTLVGVPDVPTSVTVTQSGTAADVFWLPPVSDHGSAVTGYKATRVGGATVTVGPTVRTAHFTGLTAGTSYTFTVVATNDVGDSLPASVRSVVTGILFPGHTLSKITSTLGFGMDEGDKNPAVQSGDERAAPETLAGVPVAATRFYYRNWAVMTVPGGQMLADFRNLYAKGRFAFPSVTINLLATGDNWIQAADGRHTALFDAYIAWAEEGDLATATPRPISFSHEPNFNATVGQRAIDFGGFMRYFRSRMDVYANAHGGVGVYQWKQLSLGPIHTAQDYKLATSVGNVDLGWNATAKITATATASTSTITSTGHLLSNGRRVKFIAPPAGLDTTTSYFVVSATANTFKVSLTLSGAPVTIGADATGVTVVSHDVYDWMGVDPYISRNGSLTPYWTVNFAGTIAWVEDPAHTYPLAITEFAIYNRDPTAGTKVQQFYDRCMDGTHDIWCCLYYNADDQSFASDPTNPLYKQFLLDNVSNDHLLDKVVSLLRDPRSIHFWDMTRPNGTKFTRPVGI